MTFKRILFDALAVFVFTVPARAMIGVHHKPDYEIRYSFTYTFKNPFGQGDIVICYPNLTSEEARW